MVVEHYFPHPSKHRVRKLPNHHSNNTFQLSLLQRYFFIGDMMISIYFPEVQLPEIGGDKNSPLPSSPLSMNNVGVTFAASITLTILYNAWYKFLATRFGGVLTFSTTLKRVLLDRFFINSILFTGTLIRKNELMLSLSLQSHLNILGKYMIGEKTPLYLFNFFTRCVVTRISFHFVPLQYRVLVTSVLYSYESAFSVAIEAKQMWWKLIVEKNN